MRDLIAERIGGSRFDEGTGTYKFEKIKQAKREALLSLKNKSKKRISVNAFINSLTIKKFSKKPNLPPLFAREMNLKNSFFAQQPPLLFGRGARKESVLFLRRRARRTGGSVHPYVTDCESDAQHPQKQNSRLSYLIDMGVGEPDEIAPDFVVESLHREARKPENRGYADNGCFEFLDAVGEYMKRVFDVTLDPSTEILHSMGSKAALSILPNCFINPKNVVLMTTPGYGVFGTHARYLGGEVYNIPLLRENNYLPRLDNIPQEILTRAKVLVINYPNNPTGAVATWEFFQKVVDFAHKHHLLVVQDAAYASLVFPSIKDRAREAAGDKIVSCSQKSSCDLQPLSILQLPGAKEVAIELHSLSKPFNMTGWRIGWVCGNATAIKAYGMVKNNTDSGQFLPIQKAAIEALRHPEFSCKMATKYRDRLQAMQKILESVGFPFSSTPQAGFFLYTPAPKAVVRKNEGTGSKWEKLKKHPKMRIWKNFSKTATTDRIAFSSAEEFSQWLIKKDFICCVPWDDTEPSIRFSATFSSPSSDKSFLEEFHNRLSQYHFIF